MTKPKNNTTNPAKDKCQTPPYAMSPILPYLQDFETIWEPASGHGLMVKWLMQGTDAKIIDSDIAMGKDFFLWQPEVWDCLVTNPPFSLKFKWLKRCYDLGKPFALLMPSDALFAQKAQTLFNEHFIETILMTPRIDYKMPNVGWDSHAQFSTAWFTYGILESSGKAITIYTHDLAEEKKEFQRMLKENPDGF